MERFLRPLMYLSVAGFCASLFVHVLSLLELPSPFGLATWALHVIIFVVWFPTIRVMQGKLKAVKRSADFWHAILEGVPSWMKVLSLFFFGYAFINFVIFIGKSEAYGRTDVPEFVELRGFSGHWMFFYFISSATLYSMRQTNLSRKNESRALSASSKDSQQISQANHD